MARFPRTLGDALAAQVEAARGTRTSVMGVDALTPISRTHLDAQLEENLTTLETDLGTLDEVMAGLDESLSNLSEDMSLVDDKIADAILDSEAKPITNERFNENSLSIWPFMENLIPSGALAPGAVGANDLADFSVVVKKFNDDRHRLY